ncbi:hypothetical protein EV363DRAFT_1292841 [Boletus edulis]|nr:hypothetical protein EV363DRAFT_1292841 [Boletus edulis]
MPHLDSRDPSPPPVLPNFLPSTDVDQISLAYRHSSSTLASLAAPLDRRFSHILAIHPPNSATSARSRYGMHIHDKEFNSPPTQGDGWSALSNRHTPSFSTPHLSSPNHHRSPPVLTPPATVPASSAYPADLEQRATPLLLPPSIPTSRDHQSVGPATPSPPANPNSALLLATLWWSDLEPWMDEEYAKQVCGLMGWDPVSIRVPSGSSDASGQPSNNPGYCFLSFPSPSVAASVLSQVNGNGSAPPVTMPNSNKPFVLSWASSIPSPVTSALSAPGVVLSPAHQQYPKEYSIFVGDLAPETSNSDLVAVFRNPVLGLRNDREPKFIRPFLSCKSAKIMLDPVTGVSRGYGFVRFTDEADQQRALVEMHGLYCLSRPMRISPATAKFKPHQVPLDLPLVQFPVNARAADARGNNLTVSIPLPNSNQVRSVSSPIASSRSGGPAPTTTPVGSSGSGSSLTTSGSGSVPSLSSGSSTSISSGALTSASSDDMANLAPNVLAQVTQQYSSVIKGNNAAGISSITSGVAQDSHEGALPRYIISEESWKHHAQARAILGNLIGPNGEQLTSTDPYNTTVFVGGLSPLISEETLRTFFAPFGDIHYVKVPVGKHCGFVQFVRKADAERAIEKMQGFPIGGSRIRLSWGRSQYKAAQAAAQAAQAAALQAQFQTQLQAQLGSAQVSISPELALQLMQKFGVDGMHRVGGPDAPTSAESDFGRNAASDEKCRTFLTNQIRSETNTHTPYDTHVTPFSARSSMGLEAMDQHHHIRSQLHSAFSPFSPDPNAYTVVDRRRSSANSVVADSLSQTLNPFPPRFDPGVLDGHASVDRPNGPLLASNGCHQYGPYFDASNRSVEPSRSSSRQEPVSRPTSTQTSSQGLSSCHDTHDDQDLIHDLNGTLASLDLDPRSPWRPTGKPTERNTSC